MAAPGSPHERDGDLSVCPSAGTSRPIPSTSASPAGAGCAKWRFPHARKAPAAIRTARWRGGAKDNGYTEAILLTDDGFVSEGSAEHVFIVREGHLISPPSTADNLDGITRQTLITLAREDLDISFVERPIGRTELYVADEVFLCGTSAEVTPVRSVDRGPSATGKSAASPVACPNTSKRLSAVACPHGPTSRPTLRLGHSIDPVGFRRGGRRCASPMVPVGDQTMSADCLIPES